MLIARPPAYPGVAQFGSALEWGSRGREFDSRHSDQIAGLEIGRTPLNVTIERCFLCLCHFCAAACLGGFWHKVTDQCADWTPGVPAGGSRIPPVSLPAAGRSSGRGQGNRLSRPIRRRLFAAERTPRQNRPFTGAPAKKETAPVWAHRSGQEVAGEIHKSRIPILLSAAGFCNCFVCGNRFGARDVFARRHFCAGSRQGRGRTPPPPVRRYGGFFVA